MYDLDGPRFDHQTYRCTKERDTFQPPDWFYQLVVARNFLKTSPDKTFLLPILGTKAIKIVEFRRVSVGPNGLRLASPHYDSYVHTPYIGFRESANVTSEELLNLSIIENSNVETDGMSLLIKLL